MNAAVTIVILLAIIVIIGEVYARFVYKASYLTGFMSSDPVFNHIPPPNYRGHMASPGDFDLDFKTNNKGMRGPNDYAYEKKPGVFRIAVVGDSFTFGVGVEASQTMSCRIGELLSGLGQRQYEVYNFGVNSYSPILEYILLKKEVIKYRPDLVILMLDICDIQDDYLYEPHIVYGKDGEIAGCDPFRLAKGPDIKAILMRHSRLFFILDQKLFQSIRKMRTIGFRNYISNKLRGKRNKTDIVNNKDSDNIYFDRFLMFREGKDKTVVMRHWERTAKYILMIKKYLDGEGVKFILATYPYGYQVGPHQWRRGRAYWGFKDGVTYDPKEGFSIMSRFAENSNIDFVNLYETMARSNDKKLYFDSDGHWTSVGQQTAAEAIFESNVLRKDVI